MVRGGDADHSRTAMRMLLGVGAHQQPTHAVPEQQHALSPGVRAKGPHGGIQILQLPLEMAIAGLQADGDKCTSGGVQSVGQRMPDRAVAEKAMHQHDRRLRARQQRQHVGVGLGRLLEELGDEVQPVEPVPHRRGGVTQLRAAHDFIEQTRKDELTKVSAELAKLGIDWSEQPADPAAIGSGKELEIKVETDRSNNEVTAGEPMEIRVTVKNNGKNPVYRLRGMTESDNPYFEGKELIGLDWDKDRILI